MQYLWPLVGLRVVGFHSIEIHLSIIPAHSIETVAEETNANSISAEAHRGYSCPHVCLRVVSANTIQTHTLFQTAHKSTTFRIKTRYTCLFSWELTLGRDSTKLCIIAGSRWNQIVRHRKSIKEWQLFIWLEVPRW